MLKKVFVAITLVICLSGLSFSTGCSGPGDVVDGKASNSDLGEEIPDDVNEEGIQSPKGTGFVD